jgi:hypothetical protein
MAGHDTVLRGGHSPDVDHAWLHALRAVRELLVGHRADEVAILVDGQMVAAYAPARPPRRAEDYAALTADLLEMYQQATADFLAAALS